MSLKAYSLATNQNPAIKIDINPATGRREVVDFEMLDNDTGNPLFRVPTTGKDL